MCALLDSKLPLLLIPVLSSTDSALKTSILELFLLISQAFRPTQYSYIKGNSFEINRIYGVLAHLASSTEDRLDRDLFINCANQYFYLNKTTAQVI